MAKFLYIICPRLYVFRRSKARPQWNGVETSYKKLFDDLSESGVLKSTPDGQYNEFTQEYPFSSVSAAAAVVSGRSGDGRSQWVMEKTTKRTVNGRQSK